MVARSRDVANKSSPLQCGRCVCSSSSMDARAWPLAQLSRPGFDGSGDTLVLRRSHWDRLPAEIHGAILSAAGALTQLTAGSLLRAELRCRPRQVEEVWACAFECDWLGDLAGLPRVNRLSDCFLEIRSKGMLERVMRGDFASAWSVRRVAVRRRWRDMIDWTRPETLLLTAIEEGAVWLLDELVVVRRAVRPGARTPCIAAESGRCEVVDWLRAHIAADVGHRHIVEWLADHGAGSCPNHAFSAAVHGGHVHVLDYLRTRFGRDFERFRSSAAWYSVHLPALKWLRDAGAAVPAAAPIEALLREGDVAGVRWACEALGVRITQGMFATACARNHAALARWMLTRPRITVDSNAVRAAVKAHAVDALGVIVRHDRRVLAAVAEAAAKDGDADLAEWLRIRLSATHTNK
nr:hypothetical protein HK105_000918 [Polyrhizophydium stewartii]